MRSIIHYLLESLGIVLGGWLWLRSRVWPWLHGQLKLRLQSCMGCVMFGLLMLGALCLVSTVGLFVWLRTGGH